MEKVTGTLTVTRTQILMASRNRPCTLETIFLRTRTLIRTRASLRNFL